MVKCQNVLFTLVCSLIFSIIPPVKRRKAASCSPMTCRYFKKAFGCDISFEEEDDSLLLEIVLTASGIFDDNDPEDDDNDAEGDDDVDKVLCTSDVEFSIGKEG